MMEIIPKEQILLRQEVIEIIREFMREKNVLESFYNKITQGTGACENVPTVFRLDTDKFEVMSQTDQLHMEAEVVSGFPAVYTVGRSYRREPRAGDGRHLAEFTLLEFESKDMDLNGLLDFQEELLSRIIQKCLNSNNITQKHKERLKNFLDLGFKRITYTEVIELLSNRGVSINWGDDLSSRDEEAICVMFGGPVQVTHYPEKIKFFNMYRTQREEKKETESTTVDCVDFLLPWAGETFGGSRREEIYDIMKEKLTTSLMFRQMQKLREQHSFSNTEEDTLEAFDWYLNLFKGKTLTRSGFGLGMGRLIQFLSGSTKVIPF